ncbi:MAG: hypothetical protein LBK63_02705 [Treponema sp.]|nr:hypothetical protein [Treponema sp.]
MKLDIELPESVGTGEKELILMFRDSSDKVPPFPHFTLAQIEAWAKTPEIQALKGTLKESEISAGWTAKDIRAMRLAEKYGI